MTRPQPKPTAFRKQVLALIGENYNDKTLVLCPTAFVKLLSGDHKAAILLAQILYWADRTKDPEGWFYKSYADWQLETGLSETQVRRIVSGDPRVQSSQTTLRDIGVETKLQKVKRTGAPTLHYRINQTHFLAALHGFLGQSDSQHCAGSIPDNAGNEPLATPGMNTVQSVDSLIKPETPTPEISAEDHYQSNPTHHPDEDSDLEIFFAFENRFQKVKNGVKPMLRQELGRLGKNRVGEVLERCATRGRSWAYVLRALANEQAVSISETVTNWSEYANPDMDNQEMPFLQAQEAAAAVFISQRVQTLWNSSDRAGMTVLDAWNATYHQLEMQLRGSFYPWGEGITLVDFEPETQTFFVIVRTSYARDMFVGRLDRTVKRILGDVYGQPAVLKYLVKEDWSEEGEIVEARTA